jgi:tetratricopeptide (TPR) repeat protein/predicted MPP superfamily phosphohydrolase
MGAMVRWLHLSDFHVGMDEYGQRKLFDQICSHVKDRVRDGSIPDFVFLTGDLANKGVEHEYSEFFYSMLDPLQAALGGESWAGRILAVPGNHDVQRSRMSFLARDAILESHGRVFEPTETGNSAREQFLPRFEDYSKCDLTHSPQHWIESARGAYQIQYDIRGRQICVVGINTAWLCMDDFDRHKLTPGIELLDEALNGAKPSELNIVLGHHPLDWLEDGQAQSMRVILGKHKAIYLHGHLHENDTRYDDGGQGSFLTVRCGCAFQGRPDDKVKWVNGLLWGEIDFDEKLLILQPFQWSPRYREWKLSPEAFPNKYFRSSDWAFPLPGSQPLPNPVSQKKPAAAPKMEPKTGPGSPPAGWTLVNQQFLQKRLQSAATERILHFFDGAPPDWAIALSPFAPKRPVVDKVCGRFLDIGGAVKPAVVNIIGPSGEGKSTALLQAIARLVTEDDWVALWRNNYLESIDAATIQRFARQYPKLLVAMDEAHSIANNLPHILAHLNGQPVPHFLLASTTLDWSAEVREMHKINLSSDYQQIDVRGINEVDAKLIVSAWSQFGKAGMRELGNLDVQKGTDVLLRAARNQETDKNEGTLIGAMLKLRFGEKLEDRIRAILYKINEIPGTGTSMLDAYAAIAAMHAEGLRFLSIPVLAEYLGQPDYSLNKNIIRRLADETIVSAGGRFLFCRHKAIAEASVKILREPNLFGDIDAVYSDLAEAAIRARRKGQFVPDLDKWNYNLPDMFMETKRVLIAVSSAEKMQRVAPEDLRMRVKLSSIYRRVGEFEKAVELFQNYEEPLSRSAWTEWSLAERANRNFTASAIMSAISFCDLSGVQPPDQEELISYVGNFKQGLFELYKRDGETTYLSGIVAAAKILSTFAGRKRTFDSLKDEALDTAREAGVLDVPDSIEALRGVVEHILRSGQFAVISKGRVSRETVLSFEALGTRLARMRGARAANRPSARRS